MRGESWRLFLSLFPSRSAAERPSGYFFPPLPLLTPRASGKASSQQLFDISAVVSKQFFVSIPRYRSPLLPVCFSILPSSLAHPENAIFSLFNPGNRGKLNLLPAETMTALVYFRLARTLAAKLSTNGCEKLGFLLCSLVFYRFPKVRQKNKEARIERTVQSCTKGSSLWKKSFSTFRFVILIE